MQKHTKHFREFRAVVLERERRLVCKELRLEHLEVLKAKLTDTHPISVNITSITDAEKQQLALTLDALFKQKEAKNAALVSAGAGRKPGLEDAEIVQLAADLGAGHPVEVTISRLACATRNHLRFALGSLFDQLDDTNANARNQNTNNQQQNPQQNPQGNPQQNPQGNPQQNPQQNPQGNPQQNPQQNPQPPAPEPPKTWFGRAVHRTKSASKFVANKAVEATAIGTAASIASPTAASALSYVGAGLAHYIPGAAALGTGIATYAPPALAVAAPLWVLGKFSRGYQNAQLNSADVSAAEKEAIKKRLDRNWGVWFANDIHLGVETVYHLATAPIQNAIQGAGGMWHGALNWTGGAIKGAFNTVTAPLGKPVALLGGAAGAGAAAIGVPAALAAAGGTVALGPVGLGIAAVAGGYMGYRWMKDYWYKSASAT